MKKIKKFLEKGGANSIPANRGYPPLFYRIYSI